MTRLLALTCLVALGGIVAVPTPAKADGSGMVPTSNTAASTPEARIEQQIGASIPLDLVMRDENEQPITLRDCIDGKPTILMPIYYRCPMLCNLVLSGVLEAIREMPSHYSVGKEFNIVAFSLDPKEHHSLAQAKKQTYIDQYGRPGAEKGWHFLTGTKEAVATLTEVVGYRYEYDRAFKEYNHPSGIIILTPSGKVARYFFGITFAESYTIPGGMTTLKYSLIEASEGKMGTFIDKATMMVCYRFEDGKGYAFQVRRAVQFAGIITILAVGGWIGFTLRSDRRKAAAAPPTVLNEHEAYKIDGQPSGGNA